jgi:hypothetical protein
MIVSFFLFNQCLRASQNGFNGTPKCQSAIGMPYFYDAVVHYAMRFLNFILLLFYSDRNQSANAIHSICGYGGTENVRKTAQPPLAEGRAIQDHYHSATSMG